MTSQQWQPAQGATLPKDISASFTLTTPPGTDIWRPEKTSDVFSAPYIYTVMNPLAFDRMRIILSADWKTKYDQGGLFLAFPRHDAPLSWIKAGIETYNGKPALSVVGTDRFSDWSLCPLPEGQRNATIEAVRSETTLWVYSISEEGQSQPLREIKWAFIDAMPSDKTSSDVEQLRVGVYAAKPTADEGTADAKLDVHFEGLDVQTRA
ncbi:hypothetical protein B0A50_03954 [Salinomyces thailandicus]|uniref:DUF3047 domain-containing protein n=1 Tax=Salinomyces thailandicus TaxID=706561 RepID=A0A4U0U126_9PEZI|nr:hypothetical protein B0A50_03954 [Salinomyces thailandica]